MEGSVADVERTWQRLRHRKVVQWGLAYAAGSWVLLQVLGYAVDTFAWSALFKQLAMLGLALGLPIALTLAWYHGDRGQQRVTGQELAIVTGLLLAGGVLLWWFADRRAEAPTIAATTDAVLPSTIDARPSIAVLPFENRSDVQNDTFFVDGIHDDIVTQLSKVSALRVISRTSVEQFRDTKLPLKVIAEQLGVTRILEGGVQRAGDRVRINIQLIDASTDGHLWAENYDRELTAASIFAIQSEVAAAIAEALKATLTPAEKARAKEIPTRSLAAWEAYQLGKQRMEPRTSAYLIEAEQFFRTAIGHDPRFALAHVGLADALYLQTIYGGAPREATLALSEKAVERALELDPNSGEAWTTAAALAGRRSDFNRAEQMFRRAIELNPNYATAHQWLAFLMRDWGRPIDAFIHAQAAVDLDPLLARTHGMRAGALFALARPTDAIAAYAMALQLDRASAFPYMAVGNVLAESFGNVDQAMPWMEKALSLDPSGPLILTDIIRYYRQLGDEASATQWLARALERAGQSWRVNEAAAIDYFLKGDNDAGRRYARRAEAMNPNRVWLLRDDDLRRGDYATARARYARAWPKLLGTGRPEVTASNLEDAIDLALVLQHTGESDRATALLDGADEVIRRHPRSGSEEGGVGWYMIEEVSALALRGDKAKALARLRAMRHGGQWSRTLTYHRDLDPNLASIRNEPEFKAVFADIERDMARQRAVLAKRPKDAPLDLKVAGT